MRLVPLLLLLACRGPADPDGPGPSPVPPAWDPAPAPVDCAADADAPVLEAALADAGLARADLGFGDDYGKGGYAAYLDDPFLLPFLRGLQADPLTIPCHAATQARSLEHGAALGHPGTAAVSTAMGLLGEPIPAAPLDPGPTPTFEQGLAALLQATNDTDAVVDTSRLPGDLGDALAPALMAMAEVVEAWQRMEDAAPDQEAVLARAGHAGGILDSTTKPNLSDEAVQDWVLADDGPRGLYGPTLRLLYALESADLGRFAGVGEGVLFSLQTRDGLIRISGAGADAPGELGPVLLSLDTGGDDVYTHEAGANADGEPLGVHVDLGGADAYGYVAVPIADDTGRLPSDAGGRYRGDANYGPFSTSTVGRQGAGRFGVGLLLDLGGGADTYASLRMSQGWGHLGVGVLVDDGGDDTYHGESGVQGGASMGIGALVDGGGHDVYDTYTHGQGYAYVQGVGLLVDRGDGADRYHADHGDPANGGDPMYYSPQMPGTANSSFVQGAGFGRRVDGGYLSGGYGMLSDGGGDDSYVAGVFAQGTGYWQATGVLADAGGNDTYDAFWYVHGAAAHYAIGALLDGAGDDVIGGALTPVNMQLGAGHDYSIGVFVDESGADTYRAISLAAGASNCQGIGLFADNAGDDVYQALSGAAFGWGNHSTECNASPRVDVASIGLFQDGGGADTWLWPDGSRAPADDTAFGATGAGDDDEFGGAVDGTGETALHAIR